MIPAKAAFIYTYALNGRLVHKIIVLGGREIHVVHPASCSYTLLITFPSCIIDGTVYKSQNKYLRISPVTVNHTGLEASLTVKLNYNYMTIHVQVNHHHPGIFW